MNNENHCPNPKCQSIDIDWLDRKDQGEYIEYPGKCKICGCEFTEIHNVNYAFTNID